MKNKCQDYTDVRESVLFTAASKGGTRISRYSGDGPQQGG